MPHTHALVACNSIGSFKGSYTQCEQPKCTSFRTVGLLGLSCHTALSLKQYRKWGKICWAKLLRFLRVPQKFSREYLNNKHWWLRYHESIPVRNFIGLKL